MALAFILLQQDDWDGIQNSVKETETRLAAVEKQHDQAFKTFTEQQTAQDAKLAGLEKDRTAHADSLTKLDARAKALESWRGSADATMVATEKLVKAIQPELVSLDARLDKAEPVLVSLATRLDQNDAKDKGQDTTDTALDARAKLLETFKADVAKTLADYAERLAKLETPPKPIPTDGPVPPADEPKDA